MRNGTHYGMTDGRSGDGRKSRKRVAADGVVAALDWLEANDPRYAGIWGEIGRSLRHRPDHLLTKLRRLMARPERAGLLRDVMRAIQARTDELTEDLHRRIEGDGND